jgi:hypothetical protein
MPRALFVLFQCVCGVSFAVGAAGQSTRPTPPPFVIGVYMQPVESFDSWRERGINALVGYESRSGRVSNKQWSAAAAAKGFYYIRRPGGDLSEDASDPRLLAWMQDDEPDAQKPPTDPKLLAADYAQWKKVAPEKPVFVNFSGGGVLEGDRARYAGYVWAADWIGSDFYPVSGYNRPDWLWKVGAAADRLRDWSGGKPQFCFIETSNQRLPWTVRTTRGVTADELRALVWHAAIHGARGVVYFPQQLGDKKSIPFRYDATPQTVSAEMLRQNARIAGLADVLASPMNPPPHRVIATGPVEVGWRVRGGALHVIALNFSDDSVRAATIDVDGAKSPLRDDFGPYEVRTYRVMLPTPEGGKVGFGADR